MQKYYAWKLLEHGIKNTLNLTLEEADFTLSENGIWESSFCKISISHCKNLVAVAISDKNVGLDIENTDRNFKSDLVGKILS